MKNASVSTHQVSIGSRKGVVTYNADFVDNKVESIIAGSLIDLKELKSSQDLLLVVATRSINEAIKR